LRATELPGVARRIPDYIVLDRHRDWNDRPWETWVPRVALTLFCAVPVIALFNVFGQAPSVKHAATPDGAATMTLHAPTTVRSGLLFQARFDIHANREIKDAVLVLDSGWTESMTLNTIEPSPAEETSSDGSLALDLGAIPAGRTWRQYLEFQANPVNSGSQSQGVTLYDGNVELLRLDRTLRVWP
jgi:hypothetical protein